MVTTYSPPIFFTVTLRSPTVPSSYVFITAVDVEMLVVEYRMKNDHIRPAYIERASPSGQGTLDLAQSAA